MGEGLAHEVAGVAARSAVRAVREEIAGRPDNAWRAGKPPEDPEKTKRWGFVTAKPSEYLVHMRKGRILERSSGQGASCFKWPRDSVAIIPTTIQRLYFAADQVTAEKVGVQVKGLAVFRVARPELAVQMLNFSFPERAQEKLAETLREMFVGAVRRLVANLSVEECLTRRKESLAAFLMSEIAPVVSGSGRATDRTDRGWGVVLDTIEIQDVQVLSQTVFAHMQAPYRNLMQTRARAAEIARERETREAQASAEAHVRELTAQAETTAARAEADEALKRLSAKGEAERAQIAHERDVERQRLDAQADLARARAENEREALAIRAAGEAHAAELAAAAQRERLVQERGLEELRLAQELEAVRQRADAVRLEAQAQDALAAERADRARTLAQAEAASNGGLRRLELELVRLEGEVKAALAARERAIENSISPERIQSDLVNNALPQIARAFEQRFGEIKVIAASGDNPYAFLVSAFESVLEVARKSGLAAPLSSAVAAGTLAGTPATGPGPDSPRTNGHG